MKREQGYSWVSSRWLIAIGAGIALWSMTAFSAHAQDQLYGNRLASRDGRWLLPLASIHLGSTERDHLDRGSVQAWDIIAPANSPVYPIADGVIRYAGCNNKGGYGCWLYIEHAGGIHTIMGHCANNTIQVQVGQKVTQWTPLCGVGMTGTTSFGPHTHLEIHKPGGGRYDINAFFDITRMVYCKLCNANGAMPAQAGTIGGTTGAVTYRPVLWYQPFLVVMGQNPMAHVLVVYIIPLALCLAIWLTSGWVRTVLISLSTSATTVIVVLVLLAPMLAPRPNQPAQSISRGDTWQRAYAFMRRWEGARCVHDPVRTLKGITQGTYTAWRMAQGLGPADVCTSLTEAQAEAIYYQRYWVASGADKLSPATALLHFDHAVNAGVGAANGILRQCGDNPTCYANGRFADYRTKANFVIYGVAWFNRVNDLITYLGG